MLRFRFPFWGAFLVPLVLMTVSCGPSIKGVWTGSGEIEVAQFYELNLNLVEKAPFAQWRWKDGGEILLAVCGLTETDGRVSFKMDAVHKATACQNMVDPYTFEGERGRDVIVGKVSDKKGQPVGRFRAFRNPK